MWHRKRFYPEPARTGLQRYCKDPSEEIRMVYPSNGNCTETSALVSRVVRWAIRAPNASGSIVSVDHIGFE